MCWELVKFRARRKAERTLEMIAEYIYKDEDDTDPEKNLEKHLKQRTEQEGLGV